jgi:phosphopantetheine--protein transferase-like protein
MQIGIDIQEVDPFNRFIGTNKMERIFSARELEYINKKKFAPETVAGMFCAKEAFFKAIGKGISINQLTQVEVRHNQLGAPFYDISADIRKQNGLGSAKLSLSISHTKVAAVAVCILIKVDMFIG